MLAEARNNRRIYFKKLGAINKSPTSIKPSSVTILTQMK